MSTSWAKATARFPDLSAHLAGVIATITIATAIIAPRAVTSVAPAMVLAGLVTLGGWMTVSWRQFFRDPLGLLPAVGLLSVSWSIAPATSFATSMVLAASIFLLMAAAYDQPRRSAAWNTVMARACVGAVVVGIAILLIELQWFMPLRRWLIARFNIISFEAFHYEALNRGVGVLNMLLWPTALFLMAMAPQRWRWPALAALWAGVALVTYRSIHETSVIALAMGTITFALAVLSPRLSTWLLRLAVLVATLWVVPIAVTMHAIELHHDDRVPRTGQARMVIWDTTAEKVAERPILGIGINATSSRDRNDTIPQTGRPPEHQQIRTTDHHPHNGYLQVWAELGVVGVLAFIAFGLTLVARLSWLAPAAQPFGHALLMAVLFEIATGWGLWQRWMLVALGLVAWTLIVADAYARQQGMPAIRTASDLAPRGDEPPFNRAIGLLAAAIAVAAALHYSVIVRVVAGETRSADLRPAVLARVDQLETCLAANGAASTACRETARALMADLPRTRLEIRKPGAFEVYIDGTRIIFHKRRCTAADTTAAPFLWAIYPPEAKFTPEGRERRDDYITGTLDFASRGVLEGGQCLVFGRLPWTEFRRFDAGQFDNARGRWLWLVRAPTT